MKCSVSMWHWYRDGERGVKCSVSMWHWYRDDDRGMKSTWRKQCALQIFGVITLSYCSVVFVYELFVSSLIFQCVFVFFHTVTKKWEHNEEVHQQLIDCKKAYDSIRREFLYKIIHEMVYTYETCNFN